MNISIRNVELGKPLYFVVKGDEGFSVAAESDWSIVVSSSGMIFKRECDAEGYLLSQNVFRSEKEATKLSNRLNRDNGFAVKKAKPTPKKESIKLEEELVDDIEELEELDDELLDEDDFIEEEL